MSHKKYYLCITPFFPSKEAVYGAYIYDQVRALQRNSDYEVVVFRPKSLRDKRTCYEYEGVKVFLFPALFMPSYFFNGLTNPLNERTFLAALGQIGIRLEEVAVIHCHTASYACFATAIKKINPCIKTVLQYHDLDPYQVRNGKFATWKPNATFRAKQLIRQFQYIDLHLCISEKVRYNLLHFPYPHPQECFTSYIEVLHVLRHLPVNSHLKTYVLYNGVDVEYFHPRMDLKNESTFDIGCIGNFIDLKDHITLLKAIHILHKARLIPEMRVRLIGHGPLEETLRHYVKEQHLEDVVFFEKEIDHSKLPEFYNSLNLFVLPSYFEGFGCVYTEAAACGVPFIMCKGQGAAEYIPDTEADKWLIEKGDSESLADKIYQYYKHRYVQHLSHSYDIDELIKAYLQAINA